MAKSRLEVEERRVAMRRFLRLGTLAWGAFALTDILAARVHGAPLEFLAALRAVGVGVGLLSFALVRRSDVGPRTLSTVEGIVFFMGGLIVSLAALPCGGITSPLAQGVGIVALVRALVPAPPGRAVLTGVGAAAMFPLTTLGASLFLPDISAQLHTPAVWTFLETCTFTLMAGAVGAAGAVAQFRARREIHETRKLGSYRLVARIAVGGMGEVWLAKQLPLDRSVALKLVKEKALRDSGALRRFRREAKAASTLEHPNTIRIYDFGTNDDGMLFIAMELLDGLDLEALVRRSGPMPAARVVHLGRQIAASLAEAHHRGIVHCDIKPANVFVTRVSDDEDFVKVLDFGLARVPRGVFATTVGGQVRGTPAYMPPEAVRGERAGPESDVYSLGAVLYFLLTGQHVFTGKSFHELVVAQLETPPEPPSARLGERVPADLERVIMRCLEKQRGARYVTAKELEQALAATEAAGQWTTQDAHACWRDLRPSERTAVTRSG